MCTIMPSVKYIMCIIGKRCVQLGKRETMLKWVLLYSLLVFEATTVMLWLLENKVGYVTFIIGMMISFPIRKKVNDLEEEVEL